MSIKQRGVVGYSTPKRVGWTEHGRIRLGENNTVLLENRVRAGLDGNPNSD